MPASYEYTLENDDIRNRADLETSESKPLMEDDMTNLADNGQSGVLYTEKNKIDEGNLGTQKIVGESRSNIPTTLKVCAICGVLYSIFVSGLLDTSINVIYVEMIKMFDITRTRASLLHTLYKPVSNCACLCNTFIVHKFGLGRCSLVGSILTCVGFIGTAFAINEVQIICILGIVTAYGHSFLYLCSLSAPRLLLTSEKHINVLTTAVIAGNGLGNTFGGPLMSTCTETFGFSTAMTIYSGMTISTAIGSLCLWRHLHVRDKAEPTTPSHRSWSLLGSLLKNKPFIRFYCLNVVKMVYYSSFGVMFIDQAYTLGFSVETSSFFTSVYGFGSLGGRIVTGIAYSMRRWRGINQWSFTVAAYGTCIMLVSLVHAHYEFVILGLTVGILAGGLSTLQYLLQGELVDAEHHTVAVGLVASTFGAAALFSIPLAGWVRDTTGSYNALLISALPLCGVAGGVLLFYQLWIDHCKHRFQKLEEETPFNYEAFRRTNLTEIEVETNRQQHK